MPTGPALEPPPLPPPRTPPPPQTQDLPDQEMESCENEDELEWKLVRRLAHWDRRNKMEVIKGNTKQRQDKRLSVSKHVILEDDELSEHTVNDPEGDCSHVVQHVSREGLGSCAKLSGEYVAEVRAKSHCFYCANCCFNSSKFLWVARPDSWAGTRPKMHAVLKFPFLAVMLLPGQQRLTVFLCRPPTSSSTGVVAGTGMAQFGAPEVFSPGSSSHSSAIVRGNFFVTAGIRDGCSPRCDPPCGRRVGAEFFVSELKDTVVQGTTCPFC